MRERITLWDGGKGALLQDILGERGLIAESDQGRSFRAFWDFLMSRSRQEELTQLLERVMQLGAVAEMAPDARFKRVRYDWLESRRACAAHRGLVVTAVAAFSRRPGLP